MAKRESDLLRQRASDLRKIAAQSKSKVARHVATLMAREKDREATVAQEAERAEAALRTNWAIGERVQRSSTGELGTVVEIGNQIKIKWDAGRTSYYRDSQPADVELSEVSKAG